MRYFFDRMDMIRKSMICLVAAAAVFFVQPGHAGMMFSTAVGDSGLLGNSFVDILYSGGIIWMASEQGLSYSPNLGSTWYTLTTETSPWSPYMSGLLSP